MEMISFRMNEGQNYVASHVRRWSIEDGNIILELEYSKVVKHRLHSVAELGVALEDDRDRVVEPALHDNFLRRQQSLFQLLDTAHVLLDAHICQRGVSEHLK